MTMTKLGDLLGKLLAQWRESVAYCLKESDRLADNHEDLRSERMLTRGRTIEKDADELDAALAKLRPVMEKLVRMSETMREYIEDEHGGMPITPAGHEITQEYRAAFAEYRKVLHGE